MVVLENIYQKIYLNISWGKNAAMNIHICCYIYVKIEAQNKIKEQTSVTNEQMCQNLIKIHTGSQMQAIATENAKVDITKQGKKQGNLEKDLC